MNDNKLTVDLSDFAKNFTKKFSLKNGYNNKLEIKGAVANQVVYQKSGNNLAVIIYAKNDNGTVDRTSIFGKITVTNGSKFIKTGGLVPVNVYDSTGKKLTDNSTDNILATFVSPAKKDNKYTGTWMSELIASNANDEIFNLGSGNDRITFDMSKNLGNDTIILNKDETINIRRTTNNYLEYSYEKEGNSLIVTNKKRVLEVSNKNLDYYKGTYKITKPATAGGNYTYTYTLYKLQTGSNTYATKGTKYNGSLSTSTYNTLNSYIKNQNINLQLNKETTFYIGMKKGSTLDIPSVVDNNNLISTGIALNSMLGNIEYKSLFNPVHLTDWGHLTIQNYFKFDSSHIIDSVALGESSIVADFNSKYYDRSKAEQGQKITDTFLNGEKLIGSDNADTITSVGGNDTINGGKGDDKIISQKGNDNITGGKGNDTITLNNGSKTLNFNSEDCFDTVTVSKDASLTLNMYGNNQIAGLVYSKSGNNLVINRMVNDTSTGRQVKFESDSVTIKNYFKTNPDVTVKYTGKNGNNSKTYTEKLNFTASGSHFLYSYGSDTNKNKIMGTKLNDYIFAGDKTTKITAGEGKNVIVQSKNGGSLTVNAGKDNDKYIINDLSNKVIITDKGGSGDKLTVSANTTGKTRHYIFDVKADGTLKDNSLKIVYTSDSRYNNANYFAFDLEYNKYNHKTYMYDETVKINNFFNKNGTLGTGAIENISSDFNYDKVRQDVAGWLTAHNYSSVSEFFAKGAGEVNTAVYMKELIAKFDGKG